MSEVPIVLGLKPLPFLLILSAVLSLVVTLIYKFLTDQVLIKELKADLKKYQKDMKKYRDDPAKMMDLQKKMSSINIRMMKQSFKPMLITMLPFFGIFWWLRRTFEDLIMFALPFWPHTLGWLGTYIVFSMAFSLLFRKLLKVA